MHGNLLEGGQVRIVYERLHGKMNKESNFNIEARTGPV